MKGTNSKTCEPPALENIIWKPNKKLRRQQMRVIKENKNHII